MYADKPIAYEEALSRCGYGKLQKRITFAGAMCLLCSYVAVGMISFVLPASQCDLELTSKGKGTLIASGFIGIILSSHLWGFLSDTLGRQYILTRCLLADGLLYICTSFVPNYWLFLIMRLLNGFSSCGGVVSAWAYIGEFHTDKHRTRAIMIASVVGSSIYFFLPCLAWLIYPLKINIPIFPGLIFRSWRLFYTICGIPSLLTSLLMMSLPESPKFLLAVEKREKAIQVLQYIYSENTGKPADNLEVNHVVIDEREKVTKTNRDLMKITAFLLQMWHQTVPLFKKPLNFNFALICTMQFILYFCNNGMFLWVPETFNRIAQYKENNPNQPGTFCKAVENFRSMKNSSESTTDPNQYYNFSEKINYDDEFKIQNSYFASCNDMIDFSVYINSAIIGLLTGVGLICIILLMKIFSRKLVLAAFAFCSVLTTVTVLLLNEIDYVFTTITVMIVLTGSGIPVVTSAVVDLFPTNLSRSFSKNKKTNEILLL
ncbi:synaptic vesicle glycoprotein 2C-like isoform X2 [Lycorma delicatula]|uniref:synaptic vesicle glycoprotein 2C-like isoform X2 n=1 Tax=Lycorma delicatula TaxID=130591 RepID=UPI003F517211